MNKEMRLSRSFKLKEFLNSQTAERSPLIYKEQNNPPPEVIANLEYLCQKTLQPLRDKLQVPIRITSGYRCEKLNTKIGGSKSSQHILGQAADCVINDKYLQNKRFKDIMTLIKRRIYNDYGAHISDQVNINYFLFIYAAMRIDKLDIDQLVHEYGEDKGLPGWVHIAASQTKINKRRITAIGNYLPASSSELTLASAIEFGSVIEEIA